MSLQYLKNENGETTAVLVPIEEWKAITLNLADKGIPPADAPNKTKKASDYKGILSPELTNELNRHVQQSREQWD